MTTAVASELLATLGSAWPVLERTCRAHVPADTFAATLRQLLQEEVSVRNLRRIVQLLLRYENEERPNSTVDRVAYVRVGLSHAIAHKVSRGTDTVVVYLLDPALEDAVRDGGDDDAAGTLVRVIRQELAFLPATAQVPSILTEDELRRPVRRALEDELPHLQVVAYADLPADVNVQPVARIAAV